MRPVDASLEAPASGAPYQLDQTKMVRRGRWRSYVRTSALAVALLLLQAPLGLVATGQWQSMATPDIPSSVPARLSLLLDTGMIVAYCVLAYRALELARTGRHRTRTSRGLARLAVGLVALGAVLDGTENVHLWVQSGQALTGAPVTLTWEPWTMAMRALVLTGLVLGLAVAAWSTYRTAWWPTGMPPAPAQEGRPNLIVACSGGGIRAASFCLGGLQALKDRYQRADAVVGVSGGGYMAAAFHVHRWKTTDKEHPDNKEWGDDRRPAYAPGTPEEAWLRRHSRYLFDSPDDGVFALLSMLFGLAVNLLFITALLGATTWLSAWIFLASGGVTGWASDPSTANKYQGDWAWVRWTWAVAAAGVGLFILAKVADRGSKTLGASGRDRARVVIAALVGTGLALVAALQALPALLVWLHNWAREDNTGALAVAMDRLLTALGFAAAGPSVSEGASGAAVSGTSMVAIVAAVLAGLRAISAAATPTDGKASPFGKVLAAAWDKVKKYVIPWLAAIVVVTLLVVVFLTWTVSLLNNPEYLQRWGLVWFFGALVLGTFLLTDANRTSLHHYYRERLATAYLVGQNEHGIPKAIPYNKALRYSSATPGDGGPALVTCAVANVCDMDVVPTGRGCTPFVFSHDRIGLTELTLPDQAQVATGDYEFNADGRGRDVTIPAAVAISGAAFAPLAGRENARVRPYRLVLALANARLGVWLPNPLWVEPDRVEKRRRKGAVTGRALLEGLKDMFTKPSPFLVAREAFGRTSVFDRYLYVTDGGHYDNLGLVEALRREPRTVLVLDASNDKEDSFEALGQAIATARMDLGCEVHLDPSDMRRVGEARAKAAWAHGTITYRRRPGVEDAPTGDLWVAKAVMVDGLPWDVETYAADHCDFPRTSTGNQFYGEFDLEAYRELGFAAVQQLRVEANTMPASPLHKDWTPQVAKELEQQARDAQAAKERQAQEDKVVLVKSGWGDSVPV